MKESVGGHLRTQGMRSSEPGVLPRHLLVLCFQGLQSLQGVSVHPSPTQT